MSDPGKLVFQFFNEVGIINQLSVAAFNRRMPDGLHVSHFSVLNHMVRLGDGQTPLALSSAFQTAKGTMTNTLGALSKRGLIEMAAHETDGRSKLVYLTDKGRAFHSQAIESLYPAIALLSNEIDLSKLNELLPELEKIRKVLDENRDV